MRRLPSKILKKLLRKIYRKCIKWVCKISRVCVLFVAQNYGCINLDLEHTLDAGSTEDHRVQVWSHTSICLREEPVFVPTQKCPYHVTFDLHLDLEHTLDAGLPADHRAQVWSQSSHLRARKCDFRSSTKVPVSRDLWPWPWPWAHRGCRLTCRPSCASLVAIEPFACEKKWY